MIAKTHKDPQATWAHWGNLAFYPGFQPTFFYFNWLLGEYTGRRGPHFSAEANRIGNEAKSNLNKGNFLSTEDNDIETITKRFLPLLKVIQEAIKYERANELAYFKQKYNELTKTFTEKDFKANPELQQLSAILSTAANGKDFDYGQFMSLINIILQGTDTAKAIFAHETQHLQDIKDAMNKLIDKRISQDIGLGKAQGLGASDPKVIQMIENSEKRIAKQARVSYLDHGNLMDLRGVKTHFKNVFTSDVKIAHWITSRIQKIWNDNSFRAQIRDYIIKNNIITNQNYVALENHITSIIINYVQEEAIQHIPQILNDQFKRYKSGNLIKNIDIGKMASLREDYKIEGWYDNYGLVGQHVQFFTDLAQYTDAEEAHAKDLFKKYDELMVRINRNKRNKKNNDEEDEFIINEFKKTEIYKNLNDIRNLIKQLNIIKKQYNDAMNKRITYFNKYTDGWQKEIKDSQGHSVTISITMENGNVQIKGLENLTSLNSYQTLMGDKILNSNSLTRQVATLKTKANDQIKSALIDIIDNTELDEVEDVIRKLKQGFEHIQVSVGGPKFSELLTGIQFRSSGTDLSVQWTGSKNSKNDVVTMTLKAPDGSILEGIEKDLNQSIMKKVQDKFEIAVDDIAKNNTKEFAEIFQNMAGQLQRAGKTEASKEESLHKYKYLKEAFLRKSKDLGETYKQVREKEAAAENSVHKQLNILAQTNEYKKGTKEERRKTIQKKFLAQLQQSFFVSTTVKTYNQYQNDIGFIGGSLGTSPTEQLTRLADIFEAANSPLSESDFNWLVGAVTNCSPFSVIGEQDKHSIEHYLGTMAAFALFDEGAAEATLATMEKEVRDTQVVPSILHLYKVNGIYVPGSYVLQEVEAELRTCIEQMNFATATVNRGAGVTIVNKVTYNDLPNYNSKGKNLNTHPWETMAQTAASKIDIKILFLAGLEDIMKNINTAMGNIELPA